MFVSKLSRILIPGYDQSSTLLKVSCQNVMPRQMKSLSFSFVSLLTLLYPVVVVVVLGRMKNGVKQFLTI